MLKQEVERNMRRLKTVNVELFDGFHHLCKEVGHDMLIER